MKVFLDTNILFSAILIPGSIPDLAFQKALKPPYEAITSKYVLDELFKTFTKKFPYKIIDFLKFYKSLYSSIMIVDITCDFNNPLIIIRDKMDKPILKAAIDSNCDLLITGDKDFFALKIVKPKIIKAVDFWYNY